MGVSQFAQQIDNQTTNNAVETTVSANTANQFDDDSIGEDISTSDYESGEQNISGSQAVNIVAQENSGNNADVVVEWTDGTGSVIGSQTVISGLNNDTDTAALRTKSTHINVKATGSSTDFNISVNAN